MLLLDELRESWASEQRDHRVALTGVVAIGIALRLMHIAQPMRYDEAVTYMYFARLEWADALSTYTYPNNHLFHTALVKASAAVFGNHPWALRLPAFLAGCLAIPATYAACRALYGPRAALVAAALVASSGALVLYATNARGYSIVVLLFLLAVIQGARLLKGGSAMGWLTLAMLGAAGLWAVPVMLFPFGAVLLWLALSLLVEQRMPELKRLAIAVGITALLTALAYAPVISREGLAVVARNRFVTPSNWYDFLTQLPLSIREALSSWTLGVPPLLGLGALACGVVALRRHREVSAFRIGLPLAAFVWSAWLLVVNHRAPFARVWLWLVPLLASLAGAGVVFLLERWHRTAGLARERVPAIAVGVALVAALSLALSRAVVRSTDTGTFADAAAATQALATELRAGDRVLAAIPSNAPLQYYMDRRGLDSTYLSADERRARRLFVVVDAAEGQRLEQVVGRNPVRDTAQFTPPRLIQRFPSSMLVVFERRNVSQP